MEEMVNSIEKLCDEFRTVNISYYLENKLNSWDGCLAAVTPRAKISRVRDSGNVESCYLEIGFL